MNRRILTIVVLLTLAWPVVSVLGQQDVSDGEGSGWSLGAATGAADMAGEVALEAWSPPPRSGPGATITVTTTDDELNSDGDCSLREAIEAANTDGSVDACIPGSGDDTILVPAGTYVLAIPGPNEDNNQTGDLDILDDVSIHGDGAENTILDGGRLDRVVHVLPSRTVEINNLTVTHGYVEDSNGAGIRNSSATLTLNGVILRENEIVKITLNTGGAGLHNGASLQDATTTLNDCLVTDNMSYGGGGIGNAASTGLTAMTTLNNTTISGNTAGFGAGIWHTWYSGAVGATSAMILNEAVVQGNVATVDRGGGIAAYQNVDNSMTLTLIDSLISGNAAVVQGGGIAIHGWDTVPVLTVEHSTISDNVAQGVDPYTGRGGGLWVQHSELLMSDSTVSGNLADGLGFASGDGGGMFVLDSEAELVNSTISGNQAVGSGFPEGGAGGGIAVVGEVDPAVLILTNTTVADNSSNGGGGGITDVRFGADATTTFRNSLVGYNTDLPGLAASCFNPDLGYGLGTFLSLGHNLEDYDTCEFDEPTDWPNTDPLLGPLGHYGGPTQTHLLLTGSQAVGTGDDASAPPADQRGIPRPQGPGSDIGAFEAEAIYEAGMKMRFRDRGDGRYIVYGLVRVWTQQQRRLAGAAVDAEWTFPDGSTRAQRAGTIGRGLARFRVKALLEGTYQLCVTGMEKPGYTYDPSQNWGTCMQIEVP